MSFISGFVACARAWSEAGALVPPPVDGDLARCAGVSRWRYDSPVTETTPVKSAALKVLVYSDDIDTRQQVILALGRRPHPDLGEVEYVEVATEPVVLEHVEAGGIDLLVLDGEAVPAGGLGIAKQVKDEVADCPPVLVLTGRPQDAWLATWSCAEAAVPHPLDPVQLSRTAAELLGARAEARS